LFFVVNHQVCTFTPCWPDKTPLPRWRCSPRLWMSVTLCLVRLGRLHMSKHNHTENTMSCCVMFCLSCWKMPCKLILPFVNHMVIFHHTLAQRVLSPNESPACCVASPNVSAKDCPISNPSLSVLSSAARKTLFPAINWSEPIVNMKVRRQARKRHCHHDNISTFAMHDKGTKESLNYNLHMNLYSYYIICR
jgi:hypothetical protein